MANLCTKLLDSCLNANCDNPIFQGVDAVAYIFNHSEVESLTYDQTNPNLVTAINMKENNGVAYTGYKINQFGKTPYTGTTTTMTEGNIFNRYDSEFHFIVPDNSPTSAKLIDALKDGKFVVVIKNEYEGTDGKGTFQIYGGKKGLVASAIEGAKYSDDTEGGWSVTLTETGSPVSALFLEHTSGSGADTETYLEGLVACE